MAIKSMLAREEAHFYEHDQVRTGRTREIRLPEKRTKYAAEYPLLLRGGHRPAQARAEEGAIPRRAAGTGRNFFT
jgi:hypothetical protein